MIPLTIEHKAQRIAEELILEAPTNYSEVLISLDPNDQANFSVRYGHIGNRQSNISPAILNHVVYAIERKLITEKVKMESHWPSNGGMALSYLSFKRKNFLS